eukprot:8788018-Alexandrium_andersonii.AAC.1
MADRTEHPPGFEPGAPGPKRSRSVGASPSASSPPITSTPTAAPTAYRPPGSVGEYRRAPGVQRSGATSGQPRGGSRVRASFEGLR